MSPISYDVLVVGAGPGGATCATFLARSGIRVLLVDRTRFPRDKVCGDALSGKTVDVLRRLEIIDRIQASEQIGSWGVIFSGPGGDDVAIPFTKALDRPVAPGFVSRREVFDNVLFETAVTSGADVWQEAAVRSLLREGDDVCGARIVRKSGGPVDVYAPIVIGADGAYSAVARELGMAQLEEAHYCAGLRSYYEGVTGFNELNFIELHFVAEAIPGYFWIFPMPNGMANVGLGMRSDIVKDRRVKLKPLLEQIINLPRFRGRFQGARKIGSTTGWGLPLGSKPRRMAGSGWMLVGDAASLIDPFTGEGIGNAMVSGELAAQWTERALESQNFSSGFMGGYSADVLAYFGSELTLSYRLQHLARWRWLLDLVIRKAARSPEVANAISAMFDDESQRKKLITPGFYFRLLMA